MNSNFKRIVKLFQKLPGVGPRQAARFVLALMEKSDHELYDLGKAVQNLKKEIFFCSNCHNISDDDLCIICSSEKRDTDKMLIVEKVTDLDSIEKTGLYNGYYHVLGGSINPLDGTMPETLKIKELITRIDNILKTNDKLELIIATNPNTSGETTSLYLKNLFQNKKGVLLTSLARGLASGSNLEYADEITLKNALEHRK
ncbi:MAG: recombination protein RecR [Candidatus Yanofskybacteria bacterium CG10_big_fil_rev_8_21_14_0_10_37_15]|uniref:Recombination protein RecR n=1 Tax=Candidatus Yanofskybacteria bacterium CG10_big_fil_rev_8_21_14_0_10_37_15 TaxID=1975097 RepID=A0A2H0R6W7_9BACT|nr:MAG: recombination protein RecR [Candidatus Yanofskybacteria bacterium CG10_big_fil_rev_8_21_14_0_10_37_15]